MMRTEDAVEVLWLLAFFALSGTKRVGFSTLPEQLLRRAFAGTY